jgi:putative Ca2+/H+ antiporter (TMEM165/GDT1 family)
MLSVFLATYGAVFIAEIVGDKLFYTTGVLATRFRSLAVVVGMALAFTIKMGVAVAVGDAIARLPRYLVAAITTVSFLGVAYTLWRKSDERPEWEGRKDPRIGKGALVTFAAIVLSEWGDVGQITAAAMAARSPDRLPMVWVGAVLAMVTKGLLAVTLGTGVRRWIRDRFPPRVVRYAAVVALLVLGVAAVIEELMRPV